MVIRRHRTTKHSFLMMQASVTCCRSLAGQNTCSVAEIVHTSNLYDEYMTVCMRSWSNWFAPASFNIFLHISYLLFHAKEFTGGGAQIMNGVTDWSGKRIWKANVKKKKSSPGGGCSLSATFPTPPPPLLGASFLRLIAQNIQGNVIQLITYPS